MSVINTVLKDLQSRPSRFTPLELVDEVAAGAPPTRRSWLLPLALLGLLLLAGAGFYRYSWPPVALPSALPPAGGGERLPPAAPPMAAAESKTPPESKTPTESNTAPATIPAGDKPPPVPPANAIIGLQLREAADRLRIEFILRERAVAYLKRRDRNGFTYHLGEVESRIAAPDLSGNRWLERLSIDGADGGVDIRFATTAEVLVETGQSRGDDEFVWTISLKHAPPPAAAASPPPVPAASEASPAVVRASAGETAVPESAPAALPTATPSAAATATLAPDAPAGDAAAESAEPRLDIRSTSPAKREQAPLQRARELIDGGRYVDAERLLRELLGSQQDYDARRQLLALYGGREQFERVALLARDSAQRYPADAMFITEYARSLFRGGDYLDVLRLLAGLDRLDARQQSLLAVSYQRLGRHVDAVRHFRLALDGGGATARNWVGLGISLEQSAALEQALDAYRQALAQGDLNARLREYAEARSASLRRVLN